MLLTGADLVAEAEERVLSLVVTPPPIEAVGNVGGRVEAESGEAVVAATLRRRVRRLGGRGGLRGRGTRVGARVGRLSRTRADVRMWFEFSEPSILSS